MVKGYKSNHNNKLDHIPIGMEGNGLMVVVDNQYGTVQLQDFERKSFVKLADNIASLITQLKLRK